MNGTLMNSQLLVLEELSLEFFHPFRELCDGDELPLGLAVGLCRGAHPFFTCRDGMHHPRLSRNHRFVTDGEVTRNPRLPCQDDIPTNTTASCNAGLSDDDGMLSDDHVVAYLDQIIDFASLTDSGGAQGTTVDGHIGADFDIILDGDMAYLRDLAMKTFIKI